MPQVSSPSPDVILTSALRGWGLDELLERIETVLAAEQPIAPFFRFPGLSDSPALMSYLQERGIAAFTVDVVSNDSYIGDVNRLIARTLERVEADKGGIILFHDIKHVTARALPTILSELKARPIYFIAEHSIKTADSSAEENSSRTAAE